MPTRANVMITDGTREHSILLSRFFDGYPAGLGIELNDYLREQTKNKHGRERLKKWSAVAANIQSKFPDSYTLEEEFKPWGDTAFFYIIDTTAQTLTCLWCMSMAIPAEHYYLMMENKPRMAKALAKAYTVPFTATREELATAADKQIRNLKAKNETLHDLKALREFEGEAWPYDSYHSYYERLIKTIRGEDAKVRM